MTSYHLSFATLVNFFDLLSNIHSSSLTIMSMSGMDMGHMGSMSMGDGVPSLFYLQKMYWAVVGSAIAAGTVVNILNRFLAVQRYGSRIPLNTVPEVGH